MPTNQRDCRDHEELAGWLPLMSVIESRVEKRRSDVSLPVAIGQVFTWPPQSGLAWFCFLFPLIELDRRVSRIQLSEKGSRCCPRKAARFVRQVEPVQTYCAGAGRSTARTGSLPLMFGAQPLAKPAASVFFHCAISFADRAQAEVVGPSDDLSVELFHDCSAAS